jgi:hypothetical protein
MIQTTIFTDMFERNVFMSARSIFLPQSRARTHASFLHLSVINLPKMGETIQKMVTPRNGTSLGGMRRTCVCVVAVS